MTAPVRTSPPPFPRATVACSSGDLQSARRLDWRFLLPDPLLVDIGCVASPAGSLLVALRKFCPSVARLELSGSRETQYRLVVLEHTSLRSLSAAAEFVSPGGWLYAEFTRRAKNPAGWLRHPYHCSRVIRRLGFDLVITSWHRPDFDSCVEIIPLLPPAARSFALSRCTAGWRNGLRFGFGRFLNRSGLLPLAIPCFSVLAQKRT